MEAILELKRSNLVLPSSGYELDREEMSYVEGGVYISYSTMWGFLKAFGKYGANVPATATAIAASYGGIKAAFTAGLTSIISWFNALPVVGQFLFLYVAANAVVLAGAMVTAYAQHKGIDIYVGFTLFIPHVKWNMY